eukprot:Skav207668  [mRNA]  locus=scaffold1857:201496:204756:+ [translate_table: standard]
MRVTQTRNRGSLQDLFELFRTEWNQRWNRHAQVPDSQWHDVVAFARASLPSCSCTHVTITPSVLATAIHQKNQKTSKGLDGVSIRDLRAMPENGLRVFCQMYARAEKDGAWPEQVLFGRVANLAKVAAPTSPQDFRPITVLGLLYRLYGSIHSKSLLKQLDRSLPSSIYGSRPAKHAGQVWSELLWMVEAAQVFHEDQAGLVADLQKAFNHIPRLVMMEAASVMGVPPALLLAWTGALVNIKRFFDIRGNLSEPLMSTTGVPEGCALSCLGMVIIDTLFHFWLESTLADVRAVSYVDDLQVHCASHRLWAVWEQVDSFTTAVDISIDDRKTFSWSTSKEGRATLLQDEFRVRRSAKVLGAHLQLSCQHTNHVLKERVDSLDDLWPKLRLSPAPYRQKSRAVRVAAWPRGLHGIAATTLAGATFQHLRSQTMKGLQADGPGCNPHIHLGLIEQSDTDPQFWSIMQTFRTARSCGDPCWIRAMLRDIAHGFIVAPSNSMTSTLLMRIATLGWTVNLQGLVIDNLGPFDLFDVDVVELRARAELAWQQVVWQQVSGRKFYHGLQWTDVDDTRHWLRLLDHQDAAAFRKLLNGAHFTADPSAHWNADGDDQCQFCGCTDSRYHRFWECPRFEACRSGVSDATRELLPNLPPSLTCAGWSLRPATLIPWKQYLVSLVPVRSADLRALAPRDGWCDVFTDGSCHKQQDPSLRLASWSIVQTGPSNEVSDAVIVGCGPLPGLQQSSFRAELHAVMLVLELAVVCNCGVRIWTDSDAVVKGLRKLMWHGRGSNPSQPNYDLWKRVAVALAALSADRVVVTHVAAHRAAADDAFEDWQISHNALADRTAVLANVQRPPWVRQLIAQHVTQTEVARRISREVQRTQLEVSKAYFRSEKAPATEPVVAAAVVGGPFSLVMPAVVGASLVRKYGFRYVQMLYSWMRMISDMPTFDHSRPCWVASYQLYIDWNLTTGHPGPVVRSGAWQTEHADSTVFLPGYKFKTLCRWWSHTLNDLLVYFGNAVERRFTRPESSILCLHCGCFWVPWPPERLQIVDGWFASRVQTVVTRQGVALDALQPSGRDAKVPALTLTHLSVG